MRASGDLIGLSCNPAHHDPEKQAATRNSIDPNLVECSGAISKGKMMARRNETSLFEEMLETSFHAFKVTPLWVGPVVALIGFALLRYILPSIIPASHSGIDAGVILIPFMKMMSWFVLIGLLLAWLGAELHKLSNRNLFGRQTEIGSVRDLSWQEFERLVCEAYRRQGFHAQEVGSATGDGGVDVELRRDGELVLVQCKQWLNSRVGVQPVRELLGVVTSRRATKGIVVISGRFTREAEAFAGSNREIELVDGPRLSAMIAYGRELRPPTVPEGLLSSPVKATSKPLCPRCRSAMILRFARRGPNAGSEFWGCTRYPDCKGTRDLS